VQATLTSLNAEF